MNYPGKKLTVTPGFEHHVIDHLDIRLQNVKILKQTGGAGHAFLAVKFRRRWFQRGLYVYIMSRCTSPEGKCTLGVLKRVGS